MRLRRVSTAAVEKTSLARNLLSYCLVRAQPPLYKPAWVRCGIYTGAQWPEELPKNDEVRKSPLNQLAALVLIGRHAFDLKSILLRIAAAACAAWCVHLKAVTQPEKENTGRGLCCELIKRRTS